MSTIKIAASLIALVIVLSFLGWVTAIDNLKTWCDRYVVESTFKHNFQPLPDEQAINGTRTQNKVMTAQKVMSITVKDTIKSDRPDYAQMTTRQLKALCKGTGIKNWKKLRKADLVIALNEL